MRVKLQAVAKAFTLVEMLVVIAVIGILAGLLLPVLSRAKDKGRQVVCQGNLKQVALAMAMYHGDFKDQFPGAGSKQTYGPQPEDWIWWQYGRDVEKSAIARYVSGFNARIFTCPGDKDARDLQAQGYLITDPYRYSYALTSYNLTNGMNPGMATIVTTAREKFPFYASQIRNPVGKLMLVEEDRRTIDDPRWVPIGKEPNLVTTRHRSKGNVVFADGHQEVVTPDFGLNLTNSNPRL
jgi:prepilin-type N-terminal cleavage/methylation domain-containing protein/prepilin-type processing-associated H-X9-DG protein